MHTRLACLLLTLSVKAQCLKLRQRTVQGLKRRVVARKPKGLSPSCPAQVEFGAHQVVLVRSMDSVERLPEGLRDSNALVLTVPQVGSLLGAGLLLALAGPGCWHVW